MTERMTTGWLTGHRIRTTQKPIRCDYWSEGQQCPHIIQDGERYVEGHANDTPGWGADRICTYHAELTSGGLTDLEQRLRALELSNKQFATATGIRETTVWGWGRERSSRGVQATPTWALLLVLAWETHPSLIPDDPQNNPQESSGPPIDRA